MSLSTIPEALEALRAGKPVLVADDEGRENEGDVILSAQYATQEWLAWTIRHTSGYICAPMSNEYADRLELPPMVARNQDLRQTAYTVTVDAATGVTTGISASDRAKTLRVLGDPLSTATSVIRPGHIVPLRARDGGVRERPGHTEAAVDLMRLAGLTPVGAICEVVEDTGEMTRLPGLIALGAEFGLPVITIADLIAYIVEHPDAEALCDGTAPGEDQTPADPAVRFEVETTVPTTHGSFRMRAYHDRRTGADHVAIVSGNPAAEGALVRVHSECLTGEAFGSLKCECGPQLDTALDTIQRHGGVVIYLRGQEGRGIGLVNKLRAYRLQEDGLDTLDANIALGLPADARNYEAASAILDDLGMTSVRLLTNNPEKERQLTMHGVTVSERVPLIVGVGAFNEAYLNTKRDRMGHIIALHDN
ncbi:bifunctional 3,4-dihydroxy-2-butanone 4-phosphate synthase/GTP cyclohydrolase II [Leifsonia sp. ALI-44-B]|uniref:bifunctional 3,4-dihydroxy-2-butanone-4-phosphate synthase/GTP cyclohydrolase II n=1 Tax=Leifsonia sp. ALI-44-B TaxID=1933776 RepID=UPI00097C23C3|nr:bifunctional 3,4-dihydroxy-2-butanone-4-phosphate synthase/GTP cyclohydrolase II [Leifsonia sp. ALI-44-B]ONI61570.1 bifunctional 3,4-dihydroxy-2-butanone 4-phosphate synthase/GTP cyclohydrolase II [Leifsonia sp. ALI-44-B]